MVGGEREQILAQEGLHTVYVKKRKGFVRLALKYGANPNPNPNRTAAHGSPHRTAGVPIVPAYCFGEVDLYKTSSFLQAPRLWLVQQFGIALPLACGASWLMPLKPKPTPLHVVLGEPIRVSKSVGEPSQAEIEAVHRRYTESIQGLFDTNKAKYGCGDKTLTII